MTAVTIGPWDPTGVGANRRTGGDTDELAAVVDVRHHVDDHLPRLGGWLDEVLETFNARSQFPVVARVSGRDLRRVHHRSHLTTTWVDSVRRAIEGADDGTAVVSLLASAGGRALHPHEEASVLAGHELAGRILAALEAGDEHEAEELLTQLADLDDLGLQAANWRLGDAEELRLRFDEAHLDMPWFWRLGDGIAQGLHDAVFSVDDLVHLALHPDEVVSLVLWAKDNTQLLLEAGLNVEGLERDPVHWIGTFLPDLLALMTGAGAVAGAARGLKGLKTAGNLTRKLDVLAAWQSRNRVLNEIATGTRSVVARTDKVRDDQPRRRDGEDDVSQR